MVFHMKYLYISRKFVHIIKSLTDQQLQFSAIIHNCNSFKNGAQVVWYEKLHKKFKKFLLLLQQNINFLIAKKLN